VITRDEGEIPSEYALYVPYPNPFNQQAMIQFSIPTTDHVTLRVHNLLGQEIATLVNKELTAGHYEARWDGKNDKGAQVVSGVYLVSMNTGNARYSQKICYMK
jgi:flagellar hook assembly protein FlgD